MRNSGVEKGFFSTVEAVIDHSRVERVKRVQLKRFFRRTVLYFL